MGRVTNGTLQGYFETGDKPTEQQFTDLTHSVSGYFQTIAEMKAEPVGNLTDGQAFYLLGHSSAGDGGHGVVYYDSSLASFNEGTTYAPDSGSGGWQRAHSELVNVRWFGAKGDGSTDDTAAIQAALDYSITSGLSLTPSANPGTRVYLPEGVYAITSTLTVKTYTVFEGATIGGAEIRAVTGFPDDTVVVKMGEGTSDRVWVRDMTINANSMTGATSLYTTDLQEGNIENVLLRMTMAKGIHFDGSGIGTPANSSIKEVEVQASASAPSGWKHIHLQDCTGGYIRVENVTTAAASGTAQGDACLDVDNSNVRVFNFGAEACSDGIRVSRSAVIYGVDGHSDITNLIKVVSGAGDVICSGIDNLSSTNVLSNDITGTTLTQSRLLHYSYRSGDNIEIYTDDSGRLIMPVVVPRVASSLYAKSMGDYGSTLASVDGRLIAIPLYISPGNTWDRIGIHIQSAGGTGSVTRLGVYGDSGNGSPGALILDAGTVDSTTTGFKQITISQRIDEVVVWLSAVTQGSPSGDPVIYSVNPVAWVSSNSGLDNKNICTRHSSSVAGALPDPFSASFSRDSTGYAISLRKS